MLDVETYQIATQNMNNSSGGGGDNQEYSALAERITNLEAKQYAINNEYYCDFSKKEDIDFYKSTIINTGHGIVPKQYTDTVYLNSDILQSNIDWDRSKNIAIFDDNIKLDIKTERYGELYTTPINIGKEYTGFKFNANVDIPLVLNLEGQEDFSNGNLQFVTAIDNYNRIWMFKWDSYRSQTQTPVYLTIYNSDFSIYKELSIEQEKIFGTRKKQNNNYDDSVFTVITSSINIVFTENNTCVIAFARVAGATNGVCSENGHAASLVSYHISFVDEDGNASIKHEYIAPYNDYYAVSNNNYDSSHIKNTNTISKCSILIYRDNLFFESPGYIGSYPREYTNYYYVSLKPDNIKLDINSNLSVIERNNRKFHNSSVLAQSITFPSYRKDNIIYSLCSNRSTVMTNTSLFLLVKIINQDTYKIDEEKIYNINIPNLYSCDGLNNIFVDYKNNAIYIFRNTVNSTKFKVYKYELDFDNITENSGTVFYNLANQSIYTTLLGIKNVKELDLELSHPTPYIKSNTANFFSSLPHGNERVKIFNDGDKLNLIYGAAHSQTKVQLIYYMSLDYNLNVITPETLIHSGDTDASNNVACFDMICLDTKNVILYSQGNKSDYTDVATNINKIFTTTTKTSKPIIRFYYATDTDLVWRPMEIGDEKTLSTTATDLRIKAILESTDYNNISPGIKEIYIETWDNDNSVSRQSEYYSNRIDIIQNEGKSILTADYELNDGTINWYVSYDGGQTFTEINLNEEFVYTHIYASDFIIKAVLNTTDNAVNLPIIKSYTLKSNYVALHSDLEEIQINLMKTNFKIDTLAKASRNGLFKMFIDSFSDDNGIDYSNSDCNYYQLEGSVGGNYAVTKPQIIGKNSTAILITSSEVIDSTKENSKINYFASLDGGSTFKQIYPNIKLLLSNESTSDNSIVIKMEFYDDARVSALGVVWD